ncbi:TPA: hypothetical protein M2P37_005317 [Klebsiella pneumoniae]|nr:hypothetical protein [Klebsiella pneumoniae]HCB9132022.1 hypothetical protein [Klebsiella pneumoniae]HDK5973946.1 hypothetical protein [Klebsiella pneumoniae]HDK5978663.1 hypothetical protein [Klebsiella pneumoniae]HDK6791017.1 hypothetical protein [Klebsiella pneumoniae]
MKLNDYATIISCATATVSAMAAIYAIIQSILQRRLSYKPQLYIEDYHQELTMSKYPIFDEKINDHANASYHRSPIINIGSGSAQNINYKWKCNVSNWLEKTSILLKELNNNSNIKKYSPNYTFSYDIDSTIITTKINGRDNTLKLDLTKNLKYITPQSNTNKKEEIELPYAINTILYNMINLKILSGENITSFFGPTLILTYQDAGGTFITDRFETEFVLGPAGNTTQHRDQHLTIKLQKLDNRLSMRLLQKIRKGYAEFMSKNDFNKNR